MLRPCATLAVIALTFIAGTPAQSAEPKTAADSKRDPCTSCMDGRGTDYFFRRADWAAPKREGELAVPEEKVFAKIVVSCSCQTSSVQKNGRLVEVKRAELEQALKDQQKSCGNCLLVQRTGWPYFGEVFLYGTKTKFRPKPTKK